MTRRNEGYVIMSSVALKAVFVSDLQKQQQQPQQQQQQQLYVTKSFATTDTSTGSGMTTPTDASRLCNKEYSNDKNDKNLMRLSTRSRSDQWIRMKRNNHIPVVQGIEVTSSSFLSILSNTLKMMMLLFVMFPSSSLFVHGTIQTMDLILPPTDEFVMYMVSYIRGPGGSIDLSQLRFEPADGSVTPDWSPYDDDTGSSMTDDPYDGDGSWFKTDPPTSKPSSASTSNSTKGDGTDNDKDTGNNTGSPNTPSSTVVPTASSTTTSGLNGTLAPTSVGTSAATDTTTTSTTMVTSTIDDVIQDRQLMFGYEARQRALSLEVSSSSVDTATDFDCDHDYGVITSADKNRTVVDETIPTTNISTIISSNSSFSSKPSSTSTLLSWWFNNNRITDTFNKRSTNMGMLSLQHDRNDVVGNAERALSQQQQLLSMSRHGRFLAKSDETSPSISPTTEMELTFVDIAIFRMPDDCIRDPMEPDQCDYSELGVGKRDPATHSLRWCCNEASMKLKLCNTTKDDADTADDDGLLSFSSYGRLLYDDTKYEGYRVSMPIPSTGPFDETNLIPTLAYIDGLSTANYVVMYANCNTKYGRNVRITGKSIFTSRHGYLPGDLYGFMYFYAILTAVYGCLFLWYNALMCRYREYRIAIEEYIRIAITLGFIEVIFCTYDYFHWNNVGYHNAAALWLGIMFGVMKQGLSRCLLVMVSLGWGVVTDRLRAFTMGCIVVLGISYTVVAALMDGMILYTIERFSKLSYNETGAIFGFVSALNVVKAVIDGIFMVWILVALMNTIIHLKRQNQNRKLQRTQRLFYICIISISFAILFAIIAYIDKHSDSTNNVVKQQHAWMKTAATETNYLFVLISIAILWQPNRNARQYAYVMELGDRDMDEDGDFENAFDDGDDARVGTVGNDQHHGDDFELTTTQRRTVDDGVSSGREYDDDDEDANKSNGTFQGLSKRAIT